MGIAAYNRGSKALSTRIDRELPSTEARLFQGLLEHSINNNGAIPMQDGIVRFGPRASEFSIMNRAGGGWSEYCYTYKSLWKLVRNWRIAFTGIGHDKHGPFIRFVPITD